MEKLFVNQRSIYVIRIIIIALLYFLLGKFSHYIAVDSTIVTVGPFLPEGISLAATLIYGKNIWPGVFIGQFILAYVNGLSLTTSLMIGASNSIEVILAYTIFNKFGFNKTLNNSRDVNGLIVMIIFILQPFSAFFGNMALLVNDFITIDMFPMSFFSWWFGNSMAQILVTPLVLYFFRYRDSIDIKESLFIITLISIITYTLLVFLSRIDLSLALTVTLPIVIYITLHRNLFYATLATFIMTIVALLTTKVENSLFWTQGEYSFHTLIDLNVYILMHLLLVLLIGTIFAEKERAINQLKQIAFYDILTGLPNRGMLIEKINEAINRANRYHTFAAISLLDMDGFKFVNDTYGHDAGDELLKVVSNRISSTLKKDDSLIRLGGDEFVIILNRVKDRDAIENILREISKVASEPVTYKNSTFGITLSIGVAISPYDSTTADNLISFADVAMYKAKHSGKNQIIYYKDLG